jgi:hypothetical protein
LPTLEEVANERKQRSVQTERASLYLLVGNDVNDRGEIVGQACVLASGQCAETLVPFLAIPHRANHAAHALARSVAVPASLRARPLRRYVGSPPI